MRSALLLPLLAVFAALTPLAEGRSDFLNASTPAGATLKARSAFGQPPAYGWVPVVFELTNPSPRSVTWGIKQQNYGYAGGLTRNFSLTCAPGESRTTTVLFACGEAVAGSNNYRYGGSRVLNLSASSDGSSTSGRLGDWGSGNLQGNVALVDTTVLDQVHGLREEWVGFDASLAPVDWRAYQGFTYLVLADTKWRALPPGARLALTTWVKTGGMVTIIATDPASTPATLGLPATAAGGTGTACGLGHLRVATESEAGDLQQFVDAHAFPMANRVWDSGDSRMGNWENRAPTLFPPQNQGWLNLLMLGVVLVFAVIIGPINLFLIAPAARRHRLFFSVPVISLATVLLLLLAVLLGDGLGGKGTRFVLIENRPGEGENTNHLVQYQTSRCGVMFTTGFTAPGSVFLEGLAPANSSRRSDGDFQLLPEAEGVRASGPWFASRTRQHFRLAAVAPTRGRIELAGTGADAKLTSTFEFPLETLFFSTDGETWWQASNLKPGEPAGVVSLAKTKCAEEIEAALKQAPEELALRVDRLRQRPRHFVAFTSAPAAIATHGAIRWTDHGVVTGPLVAP
jgi:hypothetical protein